MPKSRSYWLAVLITTWSSPISGFLTKPAMNVTRRLKSIDENLPVLLMTGFGYDASHSIVKARQEGLQGVVFKPFRLDLLLDEVEKAVPH